MANLDSFREETRIWLDENCPASMRTPTPEDEGIWGGRKAVYKNPDSKIWLDRMAEKGWTVPTWPVEYGGGGLDQAHSGVLSEELRAIHARVPLQSFGIWMLGPVLMEFAEETQKLEHLPRIARGEIRWCQGYSEPGYGSDLAGLQTKCEDKGDHFEVTGSKIWTSMADLSDWIFALVRSDPQAPKHEGISFVLIDMQTEGVSTSPIKLISGTSPFCETFFDSVKVPKQNLVGDANHGWTIAKRLLQHERNMISGIGGSAGTGGTRNRLSDIAKQYLGVVGNRIADPASRGEITRHDMNAKAFQLTLVRAGEQANIGKADANLSSMFKYYGSEQNKRKMELMLDTMGTQSLGWEGDSFSADELSTTRGWLRSKANSIEGGTSEVQLNVIAKRVLGLPD
ncbi:MAG: acyl-CoA dehydrogenase family protein [Gammaproteobacteria bacterium]|nr:acyl-CoA dehydrogenase family protein [Gammaproteobacteria bacterium]